MKTIHVNASRSYDVIVGSGLLRGAGEVIRSYCPGGVCAIVTDDTVDALYGAALEESLRAAGIKTVKYVFFHGEQGKNAQNYVELLELLAENQLTRTDCIVALGGGVPGDLAGFAAATYLRGIAFVQLPTTLLAAVDSSVGGKTAIDLNAGKNLAGAFYQPHAVLCDVDTLATLPDAQFRAGCAEVIKYAVLQDEELFNDLMISGTAFPREAVIARCVAHKRDIVAADEFDHGCRQLLNLGHTVGHAIEALSDFEVCHGEAVAMGMGVIARAAAANGLCSMDCARAVEDILARFDLPSNSPYGAEALQEVMLSDKKRRGDRITLVVPRGIGQCTLHTIAASELTNFVKAGIL
ncbi:MAG: 3-dehydroquinate synthase [Ruminococcaceae bacterium]|nr:3-dehydroquinate synthase [Oscillospiraceae bacterium]